MPPEKYAPLYTYLTASKKDRLTLSLAEIESILGEALPASARELRSWWSNRRNAFQASAWMDAGYKATEIDLETGQITFARPRNQYMVRREGGIVLWDGELIKALREHMGMNQAGFANELGMRQQTISEWETGVYAPSKANCKYLMLVAERAGFFMEEDGDAK
jgi:DNA-binding transcriptional regulator YiaG